MIHALLILFIFSYDSAYANSCKYLDATDSSGTQEIARLTQAVGAVAYPEEKLFGCTWEQQLRYYQELKRTSSRIEVLIDQINNYDTTNLSKSDQKKVRNVGKNLSCIQRKFLDEMEIHCESCHHANAYVTQIRIPILGTIHNPARIHVCTPLMKNYQTVAVGGILLHELSHKCGTDDLEYFITPYDFNYVNASSLKNWDKNADHFEYWYHNSFCIPGLDCPERFGF